MRSPSLQFEVSKPQARNDSAVDCDCFPWFDPQGESSDRLVPSLIPVILFSDVEMFVDGMQAENSPGTSHEKVLSLAHFEPWRESQAFSYFLSLRHHQK